MTSDLSTAVRVVRLLGYGVAALAVMVAATADAQVLAFGQLVEDRAGYGTFLAEQLRAEGVDARDADWTIPQAMRAGCPATGMGTAPGCLPALYREMGVTVFVDGIIVGGARAQSIALVAWDTQTGRTLDELIVPLQEGRVPRSDLERTVATLRALARPPAAPQSGARGAPMTSGNSVASGTASRGGDEGGTADRLRIALRTRWVSRSFAQDFDEGTVDFDAPYYPGAEVALEVFPAAFFVRGHPAAHIGLTLRTAKHSVRTTTEVAAGGERFEVDIPTRHDTAFYGLFYEWNATPSLIVRPTLGWHVVEYALGYNPLYGNSFYQGVEIATELRYLLGGSSSIAVSAAVRPSVDLGSTVQTYGTESTAFGFGLGGSYQYRFAFGLFAEAEIRYDRYGATVTGGPSDVVSTDGFQSFVISLGYAY